MADATPRFPVQPLQPGAYSVLDTSALNTPASAQPPVVAVIGDALGGKPNTALYFQSAQLLRQVLRSGGAYDGARLALKGGASRVAVVRAGSGITQATKALAGATATPVTLTSIDYGAWNNGIKVAVAANNVVTITFTDARGVTYTETYNLGASATAQDVVDAINGKKAGMSASQYVTAAVTTGTMPLTVVAAAAMTGGADASSLVAADWTAALTALETEDVSIVQAVTSDTTVHAQVQTHCNAMSTIQARRERTTLIGGAAAETLTSATTRVGNIRDRRVQNVFPGARMLDDAGNNTLYPAYMVACYLAGKHAGLPDAASNLVHTRLDDVIDVEFPLSTIAGGALDQALAAGITPIAAAPGGGFWLVDSLSTILTDVEFRDFHKIRSADQSQRRLRERLEAVFVGSKATPGSSADIRQEALHELEDQVTEQLIGAYRASDVSVDFGGPGGTTFFVTAPIALVGATKFILITVALQPTGSIAVGTAS